jgi:hypothetical protein|eukprot:COSAG06_NODE_3483_length_5278_cov_5.724078_3_plen_165_part_00
MQASLHTVQLTANSSRAFCTDGAGVRDGEAVGLSHIRFNPATPAGARDAASLQRFRWSSLRPVSSVHIPLLSFNPATPAGARDTAPPQRFRWSSRWPVSSLQISLSFSHRPRLVKMFSCRPHRLHRRRRRRRRPRRSLLDSHRTQNPQRPGSWLVTRHTYRRSS